MKPHTDRELAERYRWFITRGIYLPIFNDPKVIHQTANPAYIDLLIQCGMEHDDGQKHEVNEDEQPTLSAA